MEFANCWYFYHNRKQQNKFLFWVKYYKPALSKDIVKYITTRCFRVWVNPYLKCMEVPFYGDFLGVKWWFEQCGKKEYFKDWIKNDTVLRVINSPFFLGVDTNDHSVKRLHGVKWVIFANVRDGEFFYSNDGILFGHPVTINSPEIIELIKNT